MSAIWLFYLEPLPGPDCTLAMPSPLPQYRYELLRSSDHVRVLVLKPAMEFDSRLELPAFISGSRKECLSVNESGKVEIKSQAADLLCFPRLEKRSWSKD
ncbi:hypothetical protein E2P81_ATG03969 [Venturia nashicola]|uniref:Uncharacterized protein n=1 Tax=Venturia nashicola TaxID=86259 RepID=A0A4Z1PMC6_9PEZI|nr:hypothetical protein E6O75_ATG04065 [Venturia nashicola]TLD37157.1 hypothetical protein E2P81_ATG03969 [Venturia nashicola]